MDATTAPAHTPAATAVVVTTAVPVTMADGSRLYVRAEPLGTTPAEHGPLDDELEIAGRTPSLDQIARAVSGFTSQIGEALRTAAPTRFKLTFECEIGIEAGGLVALIGKGSGKSAFGVTMEWERAAREPLPPPIPPDAG
jgi:Trypsin-co-occurring domain 1